MISITPELVLNDDELHFETMRASGPGGQKVNKVATAVQLRFDVLHSPSLPEDVRWRLMRLAQNRINKDGVLIVNARRFRTQERNRQDAIDRLVELLRQAATKPKQRRKTKPTRASQERRLRAKRRRGERKQLRRWVGDSEDR